VSEAAGKRILIVEDDLDAAEALRIVLEDEGYAVSHAADATEGMARTREDRPDLILLDIMMPSGTEGFHFVWDLRQHPDQQLRDTPIVVLTAIHGTTRLRFYPEQSDSVYAPGEYLPVQGFLDKPVSSAALIAKVTKVLQGTDASPSGRPA
jgi:CheY-like chemotaxis protein